MRSRLITPLLVLGLVVFGAAGAYAASAHLGLAKGHHHGKKHVKHHAKKHHRSHHHKSVTQPTSQTGNGENAAQHEYGTRPGKGCGDRNHVHTGPPGNPGNTSCPPQSQHEKPSASTTREKRNARHHARHHSRGKHHHKNAKKH